MTYQGLSLDGKRALVFGGTSGIRRAIAIGLAEAGADVVPVSRRHEEVIKTAQEIRALGRSSLESPADVTRPEEIRRVVEQMRTQMGRIDILVNSAGIVKRTPSLEVSAEDWNRILDVNLNGTWNACQMVCQIMKEQMYGRIINIGSMGSFLSLNELTAYCASKGAVLMVTRCLGTEWIKYNITVNAIAPGTFETPMNRPLINQPGRKDRIMERTPIKRFGDLEEIKGAAIFLASDSASYVTGQVLCVDGGVMAQRLARRLWSLPAGRREYAAFRGRLATVADARRRHSLARIIHVS